MKTTHIALLFLLAAGVACDADDAPPAPMPEAPTEPPPEPEPVEPPQQQFPLQKHALSGLQAFDHVEPEPTWIMAVANPAEIWEILDVEAPDLDVNWIDQQPEFYDLHPARMTSIGLDPKKPAGIIFWSEPRRPVNYGSVWVVFASLKDEQALRSAFELGKPNEDGIFENPHELRTKRTFKLLDNGEILIFTRMLPVTGDKKALSADIGFTGLLDALDYGKMATGYMRTERAEGMFGMDLDENGLGLKSFADDAVIAGKLRLDFAELAASAFPRNTYYHRAVKLKAELHAVGREFRQEIEAIEHEPVKRRRLAAQDMVGQLEVLGSLDGMQEGYHVAGRLWNVSREDVQRAYRHWESLRQSLDESERIADLEARIDAIDIVSEADVLEMTEHVKETAKISKGESIPGMQMMKGVNRMFGGVLGEDLGATKGKGKGKDKDKGAAGPMGMLGGLGGLFGGGNDEGGADIKVTSSEPRLRDHMRRRTSSIALCWAKDPTLTNFTVTTDLEIAPETGKLTIHRLNAPEKIKSCLRTAIGTRGKPPAPLDAPDAGPPPPITGTVKLAFTRDKK